MHSTYKQGFFALAALVLVGAFLWWNSMQGKTKNANESASATVTTESPALDSNYSTSVVYPNIAKESAQQIHDMCEAKNGPSDIFDCYSQVFHDYMVTTDARKALELLDQMNQLGGYVTTNCHPMAHKIGNIALHVYGSVLAASPYYLPICYSGYYHGLLEEYIATEPNLTSALTTACGKYDPTKSYFDWFQCDHGLGHGIMQYEEDDVLKSLKDCDLLDPANLAQEICYGGVFMENITTDAKTGHASKYIKASDPIYPCDIVAAKYKNACYFLSSSMILRLNNYNFQEGFKSCDTAEASFVYLCYQSMGRDISGTYHNSIDKVNELCQQGSPKFIGDCYFGAVRDFINVNGEFDTAIPMCNATPAIYTDFCYSAVFYDLGLLKKGQDYVNVCDTMPDKYKNQCLALKKS